ncbi:hypothetical protein RIF29_20477 [Crotalaria pallida]|uniref:Uncharacterized protein n=1 Tax=Crotalaria pallida TaxID=3830 RepID=A0AAN9F9S1_CROPI
MAMKLSSHTCLTNHHLNSLRSLPFSVILCNDWEGSRRSKAYRHADHQILDWAPFQIFDGIAQTNLESLSNMGSHGLKQSLLAWSCYLLLSRSLGLLLWTPCTLKRFCVSNDTCELGLDAEGSASVEAAAVAAKSEELSGARGGLNPQFLLPNSPTIGMV